MSDRWYRGGFDPREFDGAPFMKTIERAQIDVASHLATQPKPVTRFQEVEEALFSKELPTQSSLALAKFLQFTFDRATGAVSQGAIDAACARLDEAHSDIKGGDHIVHAYGERFIACLGGYGIQATNPPFITLEMYDASVSGRSASLKRVPRLDQAVRVPVWGVDAVWPYER